MKTILFLEGSDETDFPDEFDCLIRWGFDVSELNNLYDNPEKLKTLPELNPDCLFIGTTGMRTEEIKELTSIFMQLNYVPKAIMFEGENSAMTFLNAARHFKEKGTKFYFAPSPFFDDEVINEIKWI